MGYRIEKEGYEYRGVKLGQKCVWEGEEFTVIGFDENDDLSFIAINIVDPFGICEASCVTVILEGCEKDGYEWVELDDIQLHPYEESPPQQISQIHVPEVLTDVLNMDWSGELELAEIRNTIQQCINSLNSQL